MSFGFALFIFFWQLLIAALIVKARWMFTYALIPELLKRDRLSHQQQQAAGDFGGQDATDPTRIELGSEFHHVCAHEAVMA